MNRLSRQDLLTLQKTFPAKRGGAAVDRLLNRSMRMPREAYECTRRDGARADEPLVVVCSWLFRPKG